jgi:hypothetical protein
MLSSWGTNGRTSSGCWAPILCKHRYVDLLSWGYFFKLSKSFSTHIFKPAVVDMRHEANIPCKPSLTSCEKSSRAPKIVSSWSSRKMMCSEMRLKLSMALRRTSSISSLNMSTKKSRDKLANCGLWMESSQRDSTAADRTSKLTDNKTKSFVVG